MKENYNIFIFIILFSYSFISCTSNFEKSDKKFDYAKSLPDYTNEINLKNIKLPAKISLSKSINDTIDYSVDMFEKSDSSIVKFYIRNSKSDTIFYPNSTNLTVYKEGDIDGDGFEEIGLMPAYKTSSCRIYEVYSIKNGKWKLYKSIPTHLPDRTLGVDYIKIIGNQIRIIKAKEENCCQCEGLDTNYTKN